MRSRRIVHILLGAWLAGTLMMAFVATQNFASVDRILEAPSRPAAKIIDSIGREPARMLLRYLAAEENRYFFEYWEDAQMLLAVVIALLLIVDARTRLMAAVPLLMLLLLALLHYKITPEIIWLGRSIDFVPSILPSTQRDQFWSMHRLYGVIEAAKLLLGLFLAVYLVALKSRGRSRRREPGDEAAVQPGPAAR